MRKAYYASEGSGDRCFPKVRSPNFNFSAPFDLEFAATLLIHPLLVGVAGIFRPKGACLQGEVWRSYEGVGADRRHYRHPAA